MKTTHQGILQYKKTIKVSDLKKYQKTWDLKKYYKNENDPQLEKDLTHAIKVFEKFARTWRNKPFTSDVNTLVKALENYEQIMGDASITRPARYFHLRSELNANDKTTDKHLALIRKRLRPSSDKMLFFTLELGKIDKKQQKLFLEDKNLAPFRYFLSQIFAGASHDLSEAEEKIIRLKSPQSASLWAAMTDKLLSTTKIHWQKKEIPLPEATVTIDTLKSEEKPKLWRTIIEKLDTYGVIAEHEFNAIITDARNEDDLRKYKKPYSGTALAYQHDERSIESFTKAVTETGFALSQKFYKLKAKFHGVKALDYSQKYDSLGQEAEVSLDDALTVCRDVFYDVNPLYGKTFDEMLTRGQIDIFPKPGKSGGAFMSSETGHPINVMLNHTNNMKSLETLAHEMGHAVHAARSATNRPLYDGHTILTAETASTLFENLVFLAIYDKADDETKLKMLHDKLTGDIATVQRQIAFFNCELEIHQTIHQNGAMSHEELKLCMQKHLKSYLGSAVTVTPLDGASYIYVSHLRYGFYVYTYAFGHLLSSIMAENYRADKNYRTKIDKFLTSGQNDNAVGIYRSIDIDITKPKIFVQALKAQADDISQFETLLRKLKK